MNSTMKMKLQRRVLIEKLLPNRDLTFLFMLEDVIDSKTITEEQKDNYLKIYYKNRKNEKRRISTNT